MILLDFDLPDESSTLALGETLGQNLAAGDVVALTGELGAGKTCLTRGLARGLRVEDPGAVASPTYLLVVEHEGPVPLVHLDAYFAPKTRAFLADGGADWLAERQAVSVVEWADRIADCLPTDAIRIALGPRPDGLPGRRVHIEAPDRFGWVARMPVGPIPD